MEDPMVLLVIAAFIAGAAASAWLASKVGEIL
jgi:hypothetical protein